MLRARALACLSSSVLTLTLTACGGGGSPQSVSSAPAPVAPTTVQPVSPPAGYPYTPQSQQPQRSVNDDAEYRARYASNEYVNALYALDNGWTGQGVTVGQIDDGIDASNPEFAGRISSLSHDFGNIVTVNALGAQISSPRNSIDNPSSMHGSGVAGVIGANKNGSGVEGIAPNVSIAVLRVDDTTLTGEVSPTTNAIDAINYARTQGVKIINRSMVTSSADPGLVQAVNNYATIKGLIINAAGNFGTADPVDAVNVSAASRQTWLFVGAIDTTGTDIHIASYSNRAGSLQDRYVVAPGDNVTVLAGGNGATTVMSGTSLAAPMVTGLAATILSKWPQLSGIDVGNVILATAQDVGAPGVDAVYGHGLIDVRAALSPVNPTLSNGQLQTSIQQSMLVVPAAINSQSIQTALSHITVLDAFGRDFQASVAGRIVATDPSLRVRSLVQQFGEMRRNSVSANGFTAQAAYNIVSGWTPPDRPRASLNNASFSGTIGRVGFGAGFRSTTSDLDTAAMGLAPTTDTFLAYAPQASTSMGANLAIPGGRLELTAVQGHDHQSSATGMAVGWRGLHGGVRLVEIIERGSVLGAPASGALALGRGASSVAIEADRSVGLGFGWTLGAHGSVGVTRLLRSPASLVTSSSALLATRFGLALAGPAGPGQFTLGLDQPLTVEHGQATLRVGGGYDLGSQRLVYDDRRVALDGRRRLQISGGYSLPTDAGPIRFAALRDMMLGDTAALLSFSSSW